jgi:hypothetical protein
MHGMPKGMPRLTTASLNYNMIKFEKSKLFRQRLKLKIESAVTMLSGRDILH